MSEAEKDGTIQSPNDQMEADQISTTELDTVAGGVLALQKLEGEPDQSEAALSSLYSIFCSCSET
jgi:hypothetical protein